MTFNSWIWSLHAVSDCSYAIFGSHIRCACLISCGFQFVFAACLLLQVFFTECEKFLRHQSCSRHKLYELVCLCGSVCVSCKRTNSDVWLPIAKKKKIMGSTIYLRQDLDYEKAEFYCFLQVQPQVELSRDNKRWEIYQSILFSFALLVRFHSHLFLFPSTLTAHNNSTVNHYCCTTHNNK